MGAWGFSILDNDSSSDAYDEYCDAMNAGLTHTQALAKVKKELAEAMAEKSDAAYAWLGIAKAMWEYGNIDAATIARIDKIGASDAHLSEWDDAGAKGREKRKKVIAGFVEKLRSPNPKPKKPRKARLRSPVYEPGTCLAIKLPDGRYLAGLVLFHVVEKPGAGQDTFGINTVTCLDYLAKRAPTMEVFESRNFARVHAERWGKPWIPIACQCFSNFHRKVKDRISVVGTVKLTKADVIWGNYGCTWDFEQELSLVEAWRKVMEKARLPRADRLEDVPEYQKNMADLLRSLTKLSSALYDGKSKPHRHPTLEEKLNLSPLDG